MKRKKFSNGIQFDNILHIKYSSDSGARAPDALHFANKS